MLQQVARKQRQVAELFKEIDRDNSGKLNRDEVGKAVLAQTGKALSEYELHQVMKEIDINDSGEVDIEEFQAYMAKKKKAAKAEADGGPARPAPVGTPSSVLKVAEEEEGKGEEEEELGPIHVHVATVLRANNNELVSIGLPEQLTAGLASLVPSLVHLKWLDLSFNKLATIGPTIGAPSLPSVSRPMFPEHRPRSHIPSSAFCVLCLLLLPCYPSIACSCWHAILLSRRTRAHSTEWSRRSL